MKFAQAFKMAINSVISNKVRTFLTMLGVIIGVSAVITLVSLVQGYQTSMMDWVEKQGTNKIEVYAYTWNGEDISEDLYDYCLKMSDIVYGVTQNQNYWGRVTYQSKKLEDATLYGGNDKYSLCNNYTVAKGRDLTLIDVKKYHKVCLIGTYIQKELFGYKNPIGEKITINGQSITVVGVYAEKDGSTQYGMDDRIVVPYTIGRYLTDYVDNSSFTVKARDSKTTTEAITRLQGFLSTKINDNNGYYYVNSTNTEIESNNQLTRMISLVLGGIAGIALLVGGIGIMNIMLVTVTERTHEIGIRKAIGARRGAIITQFLIESSVISELGGLIGLILGFLLTLVLGKLIFNLVLFPAMGISIGAVIFSVAIGVGFGLYPAIKASALQPVDALRAE